MSARSHRCTALEALLLSTGVVALAEIGDKTQLLSMMLAARYRAPVPIMIGILGATLLNHAGAGYVGAMVGEMLDGAWMRWVVGLSFLGVGVWALFPDRIEEDTGNRITGYGAFTATLVAFFLAEIGDKTQIATVTLAAQYEALVTVIAGTTLGMMAANVPAVLCGSALAQSLPLRAIRFAAAAVFAVLGIAVLLGARP